MHLNRTLALTAATLTLALPALGGCGFDLATDRVYTPAAGTNDRDGSVDILNAVVVSTEPGSGTFIASLANNSAEDPATLEDVTGADVETKTEPVEVPAGELVNLADPPAGITVTGDFEAGGSLELTLDFGDEQTTLDVPVVPNADEFAGLDGPAPEPSETPSSETEDH